MSKIFDTYLLGELAGHLEIINTGDMSFTYTPEYYGNYQNSELNRSNIEDNTYRSISIGMPLQLEPYGSRVTIIFLQNLFPEGSIIEKVLELLKISADDIDVLLETMGQDVAGAISFYPHGHPKPSESSFSALKIVDTSAIINSIEDKPFLVTDQDFELEGDNENLHVKMSLAGAQPKLPILAKKVNDQDYILYISDSPTSHIIKPSRKDNKFPSVVYNEYTCMLAAKLSGLNTPAVDLITFMNLDGIETDALIIERYDRVHIMHQMYKRLHQEDFCQVLGHPPSCKYEFDYRVRKEGYRSGGGISDLYSALYMYSSLPIKDYRECLNRILFNIIIGNDDAHTKNFSYIYGDEGLVELSPVYDIVCTQIYEGLAPTMAMAIGHARRSCDITSEDLELMFRSMNIEATGLISKSCEFINKALAAIENAAEITKENIFLQSDINSINQIIRISQKNADHLVTQFKLMGST
jgi:serine/threonine-protein kinase HipA